MKAGPLARAHSPRSDVHQKDRGTKASAKFGRKLPLFALSQPANGSGSPLAGMGL
jgi:hypothetical protein